MTVEEETALLRGYDQGEREKWEVTFDAKIYRMRQFLFYVILLHSAKHIPN